MIRKMWMLIGKAFLLAGAVAFVGGTATVLWRALATLPMDAFTIAMLGAATAIVGGAIVHFCSDPT